MKRVSTKEKIISASLEAVANNDFRAITVKDITDIVGLTKGSFYTYFTDKNDCYMQASKNIYNAEHLKFLQKGLDGTKESFEIFARKLFAISSEHKRVARVYATEIQLLNEDFSKEFQSHYKNLYKNMLKKHLKNATDSDLDVIAITIMGLSNALILDIFSCETNDQKVIEELFVKAILKAIFS